MKAGDIILNSSGGLETRNGDLVIDDATGQHQTILIMAEKGTIRQHGDAGAGAFGYLLDNNPLSFLREISKECSRDGQQVKSITVNDSGEIEIDASYE